MSAVEPHAPPTSRRQECLALAAVFLRLGATAFGGPAAHIALLQDEIVRRRRWLSEEEFLDLWGAAQLIPGPNSTELALHIGLRRAGWVGLVVAGLGFVLPAALLVTGFGWLYVRYGALPEVTGLLYGVKPVIMAVVAQALCGLGRAALKSPVLTALGALAATAHLLGMHELLVLLGAGLSATALPSGRGESRVDSSFPRRHPPGIFAASALVSTTGPALAAAGSSTFSLAGLFFFFLKVGAVLYGSGYVLLAFLRADLVERWGWLTESQLLDAVAVGQFTPGPLFTSATFIGYVLGGIPGASVATVGIFLPAFLFVFVSGPLIPFLRRSRVAGAFLDGVNAGSLALMAVVTAQLGSQALTDALTWGMAAVSLLLLWRFRVNSAWLVLAGAGIGLVLK